MSFEQKKLTFNKAQKRAYKNVVRDIKNMDEAKQVGKDNITLTPKIVRARIKKALLEVEGVKEKTAVDWANRIYQRAQNYLKKCRNRAFARMLFEKVSTTHRGKSKEEIEAIFQTILARAMRPTKATAMKPPPPSAEELAVQAARTAYRKKLVAQNKHLRRGDSRPKSQEARIRAFNKANPQWA